MATDDFYVRYYVGHKGKFGHEFLEFELRPDGKVIRNQIMPRPLRAQELLGGAINHATHLLHIVAPLLGTHPPTYQYDVA